MLYQTSYTLEHACIHKHTHTHTQDPHLRTLPLVALLVQEGSHELGSAVMPWSHYIFIFIPPLPSVLLSPLRACETRPCVMWNWPSLTKLDQPSPFSSWSCQKDGCSGVNAAVSAVVLLSHCMLKRNHSQISGFLATIWTVSNQKKKSVFFSCKENMQIERRKCFISWNNFNFGMDVFLHTHKPLGFIVSD